MVGICVSRGLNGMATIQGESPPSSSFFMNSICLDGKVK